MNGETLEQWKARHGLDKAVNPHELRMAAEERASKGSAWCFQCDREMPVREMKLITRRVDPYTQCDDGATDYIAPSNRVRMCPSCFSERYDFPAATEG